MILNSPTGSSVARFSGIFAAGLQWHWTSTRDATTSNDASKTAANLYRSMSGIIRVAVAETEFKPGTSLRIVRESSGDRLAAAAAFVVDERSASGCEANGVSNLRQGCWDSGKVDSDQSIQVEYAGPPLMSRQRCEWKVRVWDAEGKPSAWSEPAVWEMGLLDRSDWTGRWIGSHIVGGPYTIPPVPHVRRTFTIDHPIASARLYVTALGLYDVHINGDRVGENVFVPGRTEYTKRVPYHVYDVTPHLKSGVNAVDAILGDGWYCGHLHSDPRQTYGDRPRLLAQLEIRFADGSTSDDRDR